VDTPARHNMTKLQRHLDQGMSVFYSMHEAIVPYCMWKTNSDVTHAVSSAPRSAYAPHRAELAPRTQDDGHCVDRMRAWWTGPNATTGGVWNSTVKALADSKKLLGVYVGDELLGGNMVSRTIIAGIWVAFF